MCGKCYTWDNMKNPLFRILSVLLPFVTFDAGCELWVDHNFVRLLPASAQAVVRCRVDSANSREAR